MDDSRAFVAVRLATLHVDCVGEKPEPFELHSWPKHRELFIRYVSLRFREGKRCALCLHVPGQAIHGVEIVAPAHAQMASMWAHAAAVAVDRFYAKRVCN